MRTKKLKRVLSLFLAFAVGISYMPSVSFAEEDELTKVKSQFKAEIQKAEELVNGEDAEDRFPEAKDYLSEGIDAARKDLNDLENEESLKYCIDQLKMCVDEYKESKYTSLGDFEKSLKQKDPDDYIISVGTLPSEKDPNEKGDYSCYKGIVRPIRVYNTKNGYKAVLALRGQRQYSGVSFSQFFIGKISIDKNGKKEALVPLSEYTIKDAYNDTENGIDEKVKGKNYPKEIVVDIDKDTASLPIIMYVPAVSFAGNKTYTLKLDWNNFEVEKIITTKLADLINEAKDINQGNKTQLAFDELKEAIKTAETKLDNGIKTEEQLKTAIDDLEEAVKKLKKSEENTSNPPATGGTEGSTENPPATGGTEGSQENPPATGGTEGSQENPPATGGTGGSQENPPAIGGTEGSTENPPAIGGTEGSTENPPATGGTEGSTENPPATGGTEGSTENPPATGSTEGSAVNPPATGSTEGSAVNPPATGSTEGSVVNPPAVSGGSLAGGGGSSSSSSERDRSLDRERPSTRNTNSTSNTTSNVTPSSTPNATVTIEEEEVAKAAPDINFIDVKDNHWAIDYIRTVVQKGIMLGVDENRFNPKGNLSRAMLVSMLARVSNEKVEGAAPVEGITQDQWYSKDMNWAVNAQIVQKNKDGQYNPTEEINRSEMATIIGKYLEYKGMKLEESKKQTSFKDMENVSEEIMNYVNILAKYEIVVGDKSGKFNPDSSLTRAEAAVVIAKLLNAISK